MVDPTKAVSLLKTEINTLLEVHFFISLHIHRFSSYQLRFIQEAKSTPAQINSNISHLDKVVANFDKQSKVFFPEMDEFLNDTVSALQARKEQLLWQWRDRASCVLFFTLLEFNSIFVFESNLHQTSVSTN
jgi:hypothetical protein